LPIQSDRAQKGSAGELILADVVDFQPAGATIAQDQVAFRGMIADAGDLPVQADRAPVIWLFLMS
jgi:hypothetical protein